MNQRHAELSAQAADLRETEISVNQPSFPMSSVVQPSLVASQQSGLLYLEQCFGVLNHEQTARLTHRLE